jgi:glycosyltransferase involved in cell wall biosynthesis
VFRASSINSRIQDEGAVRILFLNHNTAFRGTFFRAHQLARELTGRGHEVTLVTTSRRARVRARWRAIDGVRVLEAPDLLFGPGRSGWDVWNVLRRVASLRAESFDVIHGFDCRPVVIGPALALRRRSGARLVLDWADWWGRGGQIQERSGVVVRTLFGPVETWFEESFRTRADASTVISSALEARVRGLGVAGERILRVPNGSDTERIRPVGRAAARAALGVPRETPLVVHIGVLTRGDADLLLGAFRRTLEEVPDARLVLVNPRVATNGGPGVTRTGVVEFDTLKQWLGAADLGVVALRDTVGNRGRWPGRLNDFLAAGRPALVTRVGDAPGYVESAGAGWSVAAEPEALGAELAVRLRGREELEEQGRAARRLAETELGWGRIADAVQQHYEV